MLSRSGKAAGVRGMKKVPLQSEETSEISGVAAKGMPTSGGGRDREAEKAETNCTLVTSALF